MYAPGVTPGPRELHRVAVYRRAVRASLERVWENVFDWEHLPWLHAGSFAAIELVDQGDWGWRAQVQLPPGGEKRRFELELVAERDARRYVARTLEGLGRGTEIWTQLDVRGPQCTGVEVEFFVPEVEPASRAALAQAYTQLYRRLWDEDEAMMMRRAEILAAGPRPVAESAEPIDLGPVEELFERLPLEVELQGRRYRIVELEGDLVAYATLCPHRLGPLEETPVLDGCVTCPWHGYRFAVRDGRSADGRGLRLPPAPRVRLREGRARLSWAD